LIASKSSSVEAFVLRVIYKSQTGGNKIMYKRLIALTSTVFILFSASANADTTPLYLSDNIIDMVSGNADYQYRNASGLLASLGISEGYNDPEYSRYADISRGDFAVLVARLLKLDIASAVSDGVFDDVLPEHYASGAIAALRGINLVNGDGNNCFRPDDNIKLAEAVKILCVAIGYSHYANAGGGFSDGYLAAANEADLLENIKIGAEAALTKNEAFLLLYNALHANPVQQTQFGAEPKYEMVEDETVLTEYHDVYYVDGIIKSNKITGLSTPSVSNNSIDVSDLSISCENTDAKQYLGYNARVYYSENKSADSEVIYIMPKNNNSELKIEDAEAEPVYSADGNEIRYYESGSKEKKAKLEQNFKLIYNGKAEGDYNSILGALQDSHIRLLDNNGNGIYDVLFVNKYKNIVVKSVNLTEEKVYDMYSSLNNWDFGEISDDAIFIITDTDGNKMEMADILPWRILSVASSNDGEYTEVTVTENFIYGAVTQIEGNNRFFVDGKEYKVAENFIKYGNQELYVGLSGSFCLDADGKIAAFVKEDDGSIKYGILIKSWEDEGDDFVNVRLFSEDGVVRTLSCAERVDVGFGKLKRDAFYDMIKDEGEQLIRYSVNSDGMLSRFEVASEEPAFNENAEHNGFYLYKEEASRKYRKTVSTFNDDFLVNSQTLVFAIYSNFESEDEKYRRIDISSLTNDMNYVVSAYTDKTNPAFADIMCIKYDSDSENFDWSPMAITEIREAVNGDGDVVSEIRGYTVDGYVTAQTEDISVTDGFVAGDIVRLKRNSGGMVNELVRLYNSTTGTLEAAPSAFNAKAGYHLISPYAVSDNTMKYTESDPAEIVKESQLKQKLMKLATIVTTSEQKNEVYTSGTLGDIITYTDDSDDCSKVFMFSNYAEARLIVIIN